MDKISILVLTLLFLILIWRRYRFKMNKNVTDVSCRRAHELIENNKEMLILDVRTVEEYKEGHIPGATLIPVQILDVKLDEIDEYKEKPVLVYCAAGGRSPRAVQMLVENDFTNIYHMDRGFSGWGFEVEK